MPKRNSGIIYTHRYGRILFQPFLFLITANIYSQVSHQDSVNYFSHLEINEKMGNDSKGKLFQGFSAVDDKGNLITENSLVSKTTFVNFWFASCAPCVAEFQALEKFYQNNRSKENFQFISFTFESDSTIDQIRKKYDLSFPIYHLANENCRKLLGKLGYPTSFIINEHLEIVYSDTGGPNNPEIADKFLNYFVQSELDRQFALTRQ